jgi:hypothetical protein
MHPPIEMTLANNPGLILPMLCSQLCDIYRGVLSHGECTPYRVHKMIFPCPMSSVRDYFHGKANRGLDNNMVQRAAEGWEKFAESLYSVASVLSLRSLVLCN